MLSITHSIISYLLLTTKTFTKHAAPTIPRNVSSDNMSPGPGLGMYDSYINCNCGLVLVWVEV